MSTAAFQRTGVALVAFACIASLFQQGIHLVGVGMCGVVLIVIGVLVEFERRDG